MKADSIRQKKLERRKEVFVQIQVKPGQTIYIKQLPADLIVRTSKENIVKLVTTVDPEDNDNRTNQEWFTEMKISLTSGNSGVLIQKIPSTQTVTVQTTGIGKVTATTTATGVVSVTTNDKINGPRGVYGLATANKKTNSPIIIYIPATSKLDIENRYNNIRVENDLVFLNADLSNTDLDLESVDKAIIINRYGSVKAKMIREADINLTSCRFITDNMEKLVITSKYSTIKTGRAGVTDMNSTSDQYVLGEVDALQAQKKFGKLTINELQQSIVFAGASADLKIQNINPAATLIQVENKYADVSLPVKLIPDFELNFKGQHSKVFTSFASVNADQYGEIIIPKPIVKIEKSLNATL
ncbi:MAG: hypothetical protein EOO20_25770 [Chryseobacterium sp.]|nr:MAG: hypothetical protein EOO20_25770 [Chryseobacterium sp.]